MGWTSDRYLEFAVGPQLLALWDLAHFLRSIATDQNVAMGPNCLALDYGAGPTVLSRLFSKVSGYRVLAAVQPEFLTLLETPPQLPNWIVSPEIGITAIYDKILESSEQFEFIFSYACFHEFPDPASELKRLHRLLKPRGSVVIVDTLRNAKRSLAKSLREEPVNSVIRSAIMETFDASLDMSELVSLKTAAPFDISVDILDIPEDIYLESRLSWQDGMPSMAVDDVPGSCFCLTFKR
ncbi:MULTISPECIES: class I SAM-dependent methyltransferase [unclassified Bradyrhizobium]|uniref:class I SAM-dependent methyltransferase n=1 Tax=unclassified Bradyrhizobium TaxID=2631580 RepID=UPI0028E460E0|nr:MULTISPECIES: methyltransferase domain-containing protein [unclassified Bradyrhizobium]